MGRRRAEVIVAGSVVFQALMATLGVPALRYSSAGVRDGVIAELAWPEPASVGNLILSVAVA